MELIYKHMLELEKELLKPETRNSSEKISKLLSDDFFEFCSSGCVYHYNKEDVWNNEDNAYELNWEIIDFKTTRLSDDCMLTTYELIKHDEMEESKKCSLRSSIWKLIDGTWKMTFHQGTLINSTCCKAASLNGRGNILGNFELDYLGGHDGIDGILLNGNVSLFEKGILISTSLSEKFAFVEWNRITSVIITRTKHERMHIVYDEGTIELEKANDDVDLNKFMSIVMKILPKITVDYVKDPCYNVIDFHSK